MLKAFSNRLWQTLAFATLIWMSKFIKLSFILGSYKAFFSISQFIAPLTGIFLSISGVSSIFFIRTISKILLSNKSLFDSLYYIPTLFASLYLSTENKVLKASIPVLASMLFMIHPIGVQASWYCLYWLIPFVIAFVDFNSLFLRCLGATFIAHAIGTVLYIYTVPTDVAFWANLAQFVWFERLIFALGMVVCCKVINFVSSSISNFLPKKFEESLFV